MSHRKKAPATLCLPQLACWSHLTGIGFSPPRSRVKTRAHTGARLRRGCRPCTDGSPALCRLCARSSPADVRSQEWPRTESCRPAPRLAGRTLSAASSLAVAERGGCLQQLSSKPWCGRACFGSMLVSKNYHFCR